MAAVIRIEPIAPTNRTPARSHSHSRSRPTPATYRRRRAVVGITLAVFTAVGVMAAYDVLAGSGGVPASASASQPARATLVAQPGDTLWAIASRYHGEHSLTRYLDTLVDLNGGATIQAGQQILLP